MLGLVPSIHVFQAAGDHPRSLRYFGQKGVDGRHKAGHNDWWYGEDRNLDNYALASSKVLKNRLSSARWLL
jgi:hypothetical protein